MGRVKAPISSAVILRKLAAKDGMHAMGGTPPGLYLYVAGTCRTWMLRYSSKGRRRDMAIARFDEMALDAAREKAIVFKNQIRAGIDPLDERRKPQDEKATVTFRKCAEEYILTHASGWSNPKHAAQWASTLEAYVYPVIGALPAAEVDTHHIKKILLPIWSTKNETASRVRGRVEKILDSATVSGYRSGENPARWKGHLELILPKSSKVTTVEHHAALPYAQIPEFMPMLREMAGSGARALEFAILTAARSGEVRGATWDEFDLNERLWTIPASRMKAKREHRVPLSAWAVELLMSLPRLAGNPHVFPGQADKQLSDMTLTATLRRMKRGDLTAHGFRSTFKDWAVETTAYPPEVSEMALAHAVGNKTEAAYRRGDMFEKRRRLMDDWGKYVMTPRPAGNVTPIRKSNAAA